MASDIIITRAGLTPNERELPFTITTVEVEKYLQDKVDIIVDQMNKAGKRQSPVEVRVYTTEAGGAFIPFVIVLPTDILEDGRNRKKQAEPSIFNPNEDDRASGVKKEFYELLKPYIYTKDDEKAFFSEDWRRSRKVSRETSPTLKALRTPKVNKMDGGKVTVVSVLLDPMRVFHDMLVMPDYPQDFKVEIYDWQKIKTGEFRYMLKRVINKKNKKKYKETFVEELNRKMRGRR